MEGNHLNEASPVHPLSWLMRKVGASNLFSLLMLLLGLGIVAFGTARIVRGLDLTLLLPAGTLGLLAGWLLARSRLSGRLAALVAGGSGLMLILGWVGNLGGQFLGFLLDANNLALAYLLYRPGLILPNGTAAGRDLLGLLNGAGVLLGRTGSWLVSLGGANPGFDPVATALIWSLAFWMVAAWAGWMIRRKNAVLPGLIPAVALLASSLAFVRAAATPLLLLLPILFLLIAKASYESLERGWQTAGVDFSEDIRIDVALAVILVSLGLTTAAAVAPAISLHDLIDFANRLGQSHGAVIQTTGRGLPGGGGSPEEEGNSEAIGKSLGLQPQVTPQGEGILTRLQTGGLPQDHLIGSGPELSHQIVMTIQIEDSPADLPINLYWRGVVYDRYTGHGWASGPIKTITYPANDASQTAALPLQGLVRQKVQLAGKSGGDNLLFTAGTLASVDWRYIVAWRALPDPDKNPQGDIFGATSETNSYRAESLVSWAGVDALRSAGENYPAWVRADSFSLPDDIPARVLALARDLTATQPTPYDRAVAIETYLRRYPYTLDVPKPPLDRDVADYFLFDLKKGYCDYYATAMVVLARAAGLPARLATGFATGTYQAQNSQYVVTAADAHSWPEIYFPKYGWIRFEPTAGRPALQRSQESTPVEAPNLNPQGQANPGGLTLPAWGSVLRGIAVLLAASLLLVFGWTLQDTWRLHRLVPQTAISILFSRLHQRGVPLVAGSQKGDTPHEFAVNLEERMVTLGQGKRWEVALFNAVQEIRQLADLYAQAAYSPHPPDSQDQSRAIQAWGSLRWRLWLARLIQR